MTKPIKTRLNALFQMEWLSMNILDERPPTAEELSDAMEWAHKLSDQVIKEYVKSQLKPQGEKPKPKKICDCWGNETGVHDEFCHRYKGEFSL